MSGHPAACQAPWAALVVDDDAGVRQSLRLCLEAAGARVLGVASGRAALEALDRGHFDVVFLDLWLGPEAGMDLLPEMLQRQTDLGVIVVTAFASIESAVDAIKRGAVDYIPKPFTPDQIRLTANRVLEGQRLRRRLAELEEALDETGEASVFESHNQSFRQFLSVAARAAASEAVILLRGESGTGKNVLARWLRANSLRAEAPFAAVNCPALSGDLMTSALFGHRKGAFTGAISDVAGKVQEAEGGTLFLDEVGELTADAQARLLRFLNDRTYERLGEARERRADVRLIAATNRILENEVKAGRFREDLFYRINVITLTLPALRDRVEDIPSLAQHYLAMFSRKQGRLSLAFSPEAEQAMLSHAWRGNLRELRNGVERAVILAPGPVLTPLDLGLHLRASCDQDGQADHRARVGAAISLAALEREHIARIVAQSSSLEAAARTLDIDATTLQRKRKRFGLA
ncbi:MAG: sigma-54-dependent Fis family transcriptional regulator [Acidobacteria bacterium]|nr:MAG: sigma-54-dependent Fis family transcriptional regulator [Acidobacteriota bacterium]